MCFRSQAQARLNPPPVIDTVGSCQVLLDNLLLGGTKQRVVLDLLKGGLEYVYASPAYGYAQVALAVGCQALGVQATVFVAKRNNPHPRTLLAKKLGAKIVQVPYGYLSNVQSKAKDYARLVGAQYLGFGFDTPAMQTALAKVAADLPISPKQVWVAAGSGTLSRALQIAWPDADHHAVAVGKDPDVGGATLWHAPEAFSKPAKDPPPYPSCDNYDAKVWQFAKRHAHKGALIWNVAG